MVGSSNETVPEMAIDFPFNSQLNGMYTSRPTHLMLGESHRIPTLIQVGEYTHGLELCSAHT